MQEASTGQVLMLAYMNRESLEKTLSTGYTWFYSRSRKTLWNKGASSGHRQKVQRMYYDCDEDTILAVVEQTGNACHTGAHSCFYRAFPDYEKIRRGKDGSEFFAKLILGSAGPQGEPYRGVLHLLFVFPGIG